MAEAAARTTKDTQTSHTTEARTLREQIIRARNLWPELSYIPAERPDEPEGRKNIRTSVREKLNDPKARAALEARADQHAKGYPKEERAKAREEFINTYLRGAESFAIAVSESAPHASFSIDEVLLVYAQEFESLYSDALEKKASRSAALGIASQSYRFDSNILSDTFEALGITPETPDEIRTQVLNELAETTHLQPNSVLEQVYAHRFKRDHKPKDTPLVPEPEKPHIVDLPPPTPSPEVPDSTPKPTEQPEPAPTISPEGPKVDESPTHIPEMPQADPSPEPEVAPTKKVETRPIEVGDQSDRKVEEENRKGQYLIPLDQARPLKRIVGFSEKEKRAALHELANYLKLTNSDLVNGLERRAQSWSELHTRIRKFKIARQRMYAEGRLTTEDTKDVFELTFPVAWAIVELFRDESEKGLNITNVVRAIRYAHQAGLFLTDVTWDNRTVGWRIGFIIGARLRRSFDRVGDTLPAGYTSMANRFFAMVSHLENEAHEPLQFSVRTFLHQNKELARFARSLIYSYKSSLEDAMIPTERGAAAVRMLAAKFIEYGLISEKDSSIIAKNYLPREPESTTDYVFNALPWQVRQALWWMYEQWARIRG